MNNSLPSSSPLPPPKTGLPDLAARNDVAARIREDGPMRFDEFMRLALYHPHYGYYSRGDRIFGSEGDFITAPGLSPLFGQTLGRALGGLIEGNEGTTGGNTAAACKPIIYEFGAGDGRLACDILSAIGSQVEKYNIIDLSGGLKEKQAERIQRELPAEFASKVNWLNALPDSFEGVVIGNELLDALPVRRFVWTSEGVLETFVTVNETQNSPYPQLACIDLPAAEDITQFAEQLRAKHGPWPSPYRSEWGLEARAWIETVTQKLRGFALMIDYGRDSEHYYNHTQNQGFLRAHSQHVAHDGFLQGIGLQDLTCHVDFSGIYESIVHAGGELEGYCTQSAFLRHHGILDLAASDAQFLDPLEGGAHRQAINMLLSEAEMGDTFKVMCWSKGVAIPEGKLHSGFIQHDLSHLL